MLTSESSTQPFCATASKEALQQSQAHMDGQVSVLLTPVNQDFTLLYQIPTLAVKLRIFLLNLLTLALCLTLPVST